jgi:molybdate/tungstate transport system substrate-binding protein
VPGVTIRRPAAATAAALMALPLLAGCGNASSAAAVAPATAATSGRSGPVDVYYAGSLETLMDSSIGPSFDSATGYTFTGTSGDSGALANEIKARSVAADIYISANPSKDHDLEGAANGNLVRWYATFATSKLVLGYDPSSRYAASLTSEPWYRVLSRPGILVGRTDPVTDPKGVLTVAALDDAATAYGLPGLRAVGTDTSDVFPETSLVGRLQAGQLDVGFIYAVEAAASKIPTVPLAGVPAFHATYTVTVPADAPHPAAAAAFLAYLLGKRGSAALSSGGLTVTDPATLSGTPPASLQPAVSGQ